MFSDAELELLEEALIVYGATTWDTRNQAEQRILDSILSKIESMLNG